MSNPASRNDNDANHGNRRSSRKEHVSMHQLELFVGPKCYGDELGRVAYLSDFAIWI